MTNTNAKVQSVEFLTSDSESSSSDQRSLLLHNLQQYGWSPISILVSGNKAKEWILPPTKEAVLQVMKEQHANRNSSNINTSCRLTYRSAESGAQGGTPEPKESLELKRSEVVSSSVSSSSLVDEWCWAMSEIAQSVTQLLELPPNTLIVTDDEEENKIDDKCLDLLRVFSYHATPDGPQLGSSPHTDWGSWTIVWQDNVGGLETYSREHQQWEAVPTATFSANANHHCRETYWHCIVHVGDMASLALQKNSSATENTTSETPCYWPSPEHRVQTSTTQKRASLVYFGYPPANTSIHTIRQRLRDWKLSCRGSPLPLSEYYLLRNQSSSSKEEDAGNVKERQLQEYYEVIEKLTIQEVIQEKWKQVQRSD